MWWRRSWFSLNGTIGIQGQERGALLRHSAPQHQPTDPCTTLALDRAELRRRKRSALRLMGFLQRALGYSLTGLTTEQVFFIAHGTGQNGKSTLLEIIRAAFGDYARSTDTETFAANDRRDASGPTEHIARLHGARLITAVENSEDQPLDEKLIKQITGGDKITARHLYQASFEFVPTFKVWIAANSLPEIRGQDP